MMMKKDLNLIKCSASEYIYQSSIKHWEMCLINDAKNERNTKTHGNGIRRASDGHF